MTITQLAPVPDEHVSTVRLETGRNPIMLKPVRVVRIDAGTDYTSAQVWRGGGLTILAGDDPTHHGTLRHVSISHKHRYPTWEEITAVRAAFFADDVDVMMMLPVAEDYVSIHPNCFHLWQCPDRWEVR